MHNSVFRRVSLLAFAAVALAFTIIIGHPLQAFAQEAAETVTIPYGSWIEQSAPAIASVVMAILAWLMRKLPAAVVDMLRTMKAEQLLEKAVTYGVNSVAGASFDKKLTVSVGNAVIANGVQYAVDNGPGWMTKWLGGPEAIAAKIIARLPLEDNAAVAVSALGKPILVAN
jgi:hypothetical protein